MRFVVLVVFVASVGNLLRLPPGRTQLLAEFVSGGAAVFSWFLLVEFALDDLARRVRRGGKELEKP